MLQRTIPSSGETLPVIGLGTWQTFDVSHTAAYAPLAEVLGTLHTMGGRCIDSSPMYGKAEEVVGTITSGMKTGNDFFYATKIWTTGLQQGITQMEQSLQKMKRPTMDLMQIHNLVDWKTHLPQLRKWKESGRIRYVGITHYTDDSHAALEAIIKTEKIDFVQFNYSILSRHAGQRLLPAAAHHGVATLINRPLGEGHLFNLVKGKPLPSWAGEYGLDNWAVYFLKYLISNPAVTCLLPATSNPRHAADNLLAGIGPQPDEQARKKMVEYLKSL